MSRYRRFRSPSRVVPYPFCSRRRGTIVPIRRLWQMQGVVREVLVPVYGMLFLHQKEEYSSKQTKLELLSSSSSSRMTILFMDHHLLISQAPETHERSLVPASLSSLPEQGLLNITVPLILSSWVQTKLHSKESVVTGHWGDPFILGHRHYQKCKDIAPIASPPPSGWSGISQTFQSSGTLFPLGLPVLLGNLY